MTAAATPPTATGPGRPWLAFAAAVLVAAVFAGYLNGLRAPFVFDDVTAIPENPSIRHLWPLPGPLNPPPEATTMGGRPLANLSLALNYAVSGEDPWSYHLANIAVHALAALALLGVVRRTLLTPRLRERFGRDALALGFATALLWALHPMQAESVTYVVQRVESLVGLFYLLTLYCFIRSTASGSRGWGALAVATCLAGMCTKEVMATAPLLVLIYDRTFIAGSFREALRERRGLYLCLAATWLPLVALVAGTGFSRGGSAGFGSAPAAAYWLTQFRAIALYLRHALWPSGLVFDYGVGLVRSPAEAAPYAALVAALVVGAVAAARLRPAAGFLGAWFFLILAPSSAVPVATQTMAEHRMYLPLAAVAAAFVLLPYRLAGRRGLLLAAAAALALFPLTRARNAVFGSALSLWGDTAEKVPGSARAHNNLGLALFRAGRDAEAIAQYRASLAIEPGDQGTRSNLGNALARAGRTAEAIEQYEAAVRIQPDFAPALYNLGRAQYGQGQFERAVASFEAVIRIQPDYAEAYDGLGKALAGIPGRGEEALERMRQALRLKPVFPEAHYDLGVALAAAGRPAEAVPEYEQALEQRPDYPEASNNLGVILCASGRVQEGIGRIEAAVRMNPDYAKGHFDLGNALAQAGRVNEAVAEFQEALRVDPSMAEANNNLGMILCRSGRMAEGLAHIEAAIRSKPDFAPAHFIRGLALLQTGRRLEAADEFGRVLELRPNDPAALKMLEMIRSSP